MSLYRRTTLVALVGGAAIILGGCALPSTTDSDSDSENGPDVEFEIQYCEGDGRGGLQSDRCTTDPDRYSGGSDTGYPYVGGDDGGRSSSGSRSTGR